MSSSPSPPRLNVKLNWPGVSGLRFISGAIRPIMGPTSKRYSPRPPGVTKENIWLPSSAFRVALALLPAWRYSRSTLSPGLSFWASSTSRRPGESSSEFAASEVPLNFVITSFALIPALSAGPSGTTETTQRAARFLLRIRPHLGHHPDPTTVGIATPSAPGPRRVAGAARAGSRAPRLPVAVSCQVPCGGSELTTPEMRKPGGWSQGGVWGMGYGVSGTGYRVWGIGYRQAARISIYHLPLATYHSPLATPPAGPLHPLRISPEDPCAF